MRQLIPTAKLRLEDLPGPSASWSEISEFALTFDGYAEAESFENAARIANERRCESLQDLRMCLFFEQRRFRHFGHDPEGDDLRYVAGLVDKIREYISSGLGPA
jgi:hypothetical protein